MAEEKDENQEKKSSFKERFLGFLDKSVVASKKGFKTAGEKISDFGDKSVQKIEINQQKSKLEKLYKDLGKSCYDILSQSKKAAVTSDADSVKDLYKQITELLNDIQSREDVLENGKDSSETKSKKKESSSEKTVIVQAETADTAEKATVAKKTPAKTTTAKATAAKTTTAKKTVAKTTTEKSTAAKKTTTKSTATKSTAAKSTAAKSTASAKTTTAKKPAAKKSTATTKK